MGKKDQPAQQAQQAQQAQHGRTLRQRVAKGTPGYPQPDAAAIKAAGRPLFSPGPNTGANAAASNTPENQPTGALGYFAQVFADRRDMFQGEGLLGIIMLLSIYILFFARVLAGLADSSNEMDTYGPSP